MNRKLFWGLSSNTLRTERLLGKIKLNEILNCRFECSTICFYPGFLKFLALYPSKIKFTLVHGAFYLWADSSLIGLTLNSMLWSNPILCPNYLYKTETTCPFV